MTALIVENIGKTYRNGVKALDDISLQIEKSELFTILGPNGAGKTTLLRIIATQLLPTRGKAHIFGCDVVKQPHLVRNLIGIVPQDVISYGSFTPFDYAYFFPLLRGMDRNKARENAEKALKAVELWDLRKRYCFTLSGGERRRAVISGILASDVDFLMLDEPTSGLDAVSRRKVWSTLRELVKLGKTIILTTHNMEEAEMVSDRICIVNKGNKVIEGTPELIKGQVTEKYRVVVKGTIPGRESVNLGDKNIYYTRNEEEALVVLKDALHSGYKAEISPVNLEDVFIKLLGGWENENN